MLRADVRLERGPLLAQPEVADLGRAVLVDQDVGGLRAARTEPRKRRERWAMRCELACVGGCAVRMCMRHAGTHTRPDLIWSAVP
jgi:hypothetical protein